MLPAAVGTWTHLQAPAVCCNKPKLTLIDKLNRYLEIGRWRVSAEPPLGKSYVQVREILFLQHKQLTLYREEGNWMRDTEEITNYNI
jgi:hypothetical protein